MTKLECFLAKQTPEALKKASLNFDRLNEFYMEKLSFSLLTLGASREEILEILKEELDILDELYTTRVELSGI